MLMAYNEGKYQNSNTMLAYVAQMYNAYNLLTDYRVHTPSMDDVIMGYDVVALSAYNFNTAYFVSLDALSNILTGYTSYKNWMFRF